MSDTKKIRRPKIVRAVYGPSGRVEHDSRGNAIWTRSRATDTQELPDTAALSIVEDTAAQRTTRINFKKYPR